MPDNLCYSYNFNCNRTHFDEIVCPAVSFSFYADEPLISKFQVDNSISYSDWLVTEVVSNYLDKIPNAVSYLQHDFIPIRISISDEVIGIVNGKPFRQWKHSLEGYVILKTGLDSTKPVITNYSISVEYQSSGHNLYKFVIYAVNRGQEPVILYDIGSRLDIPGFKLSDDIKPVCTHYSFNDAFDENGIYVWNATYEGESSFAGNDNLDNLDNPSLDASLNQSEETSISYELNGLSVHTVDGELVVLKRSNTPITKKTISIYSDSEDMICTLGEQYKGGIALSETVIKETINKNGSETSSTYKHTIEVEL